MPRASQPLMGIWNTADRSPRGLRRPLTTPHGDLEQIDGARGHGVGSSHNPSWGFGTHKSQGSTYQHVLSQPLMGIWNDKEPELDIGIVDLTTPHGDLELAFRRPRAGTTPPHNPSWGFGTDTEAGRTEAQRLSQPLMGIWNDVDAHAGVVITVSHNPSWGFGTGPARPH